jgi:signal transduction histidine kinase/ActR/RegA family two-component response regulator
MNPRVRAREERRLLIAAFAGVALLIVIGVGLAMQNERVYRLRAVGQTAVQAKILAGSVPAALSFRDAAALQEYVDALEANPDIAVAGVYDQDGQLAAAFRRSGDPPPPRMTARRESGYADGVARATEPVVQGAEPLGAVFLRTQPEPAMRFLRRQGPLSLLIIMSLLVVAAMLRATRELQSRARALAEANQNLTLEMQERAKAERALVQSQKMESLGQLTGGVAHDFNNLLTVILGGLETIGRQMQGLPDNAQTARLGRARDMAVQGAERAAQLTTRLLAFARRQPLARNVVDANKLIAGMVDLINRTLGDNISVETVLAAGLWRTEADQGQIENALLNLAINGRDAMPEGGRLTLETANVFLDEAYVASLTEPAPPGQYVMLAVTDQGVGMDSDTLTHVFEPFFTTKEVGKGTGLGLSQVYGFVRQSGGAVRIDSEVGEGTTVKIYLPRMAGEQASAEVEAASIAPESVRGHETILLVEDHDELRAYSSGILRELGYNVLTAANGMEAMATLEDNPAVDLLFTDVVLPGGMNGRQIADEALRRRPDLKVLFTTGYTRNAIVHNGALDRGVELIAKPFGFDQLALKVRRILDGDTPAGV